MSQSVRRVARGLPIEGVELTEEKLAKMIDALHATADPMDRRTALRLPVEGFVQIALAMPGAAPQARRVAVYDLSRTGVAIIDLDPIEPGRQFNMLIARQNRRPIEVLCLARHCRSQGEGFIIGAQFGVSWLRAVGAAVIPPRP
ncbi:MAG TPA: hypothetical protein VGR35_13230 [Tepidisphaeraceae bacterium]|nr:hypothetical protein [Tepidisphaeraceae bacterium]